MAEAEEREGLAAEYALGTLDTAERAEADALRVRDRDFDALATRWERQLSPLALALEPLAPPADLRSRVLASIPIGTDSVVRLRRRAERWRGLAMGASAIAAALALFIIVRAAPEPAGGRYVALLQSNGPEPAFVASIDLASGTISVRTLAAKPESGKSYELWAIGAGRAKPQSLGVIDASFRIPSGKLGKLDPATLAETVFAVSLEPEGGSPTGEVTGPVLFTGKLVPAD